MVPLLRTPRCTAALHSVRGHGYLPFGRMPVGRGWRLLRCRYVIHQNARAPSHAPAAVSKYSFLIPCAATGVDCAVYAVSACPTHINCLALGDFCTFQGGSPCVPLPPPSAPLPPYLYYSVRPPLSRVVRHAPSLDADIDCGQLDYLSDACTSQNNCTRRCNLQQCATCQGAECVELSCDGPALCSEQNDAGTCANLGTRSQCNWDQEAELCRPGEGCERNTLLQVSIRPASMIDTPPSSHFD